MADSFNSTTTPATPPAAAAAAPNPADYTQALQNAAFWQKYNNINGFTPADALQNALTKLNAYGGPQSSQTSNWSGNVSPLEQLATSINTSPGDNGATANKDARSQALMDELYNIYKGPSVTGTSPYDTSNQLDMTKNVINQVAGLKTPFNGTAATPQWEGSAANQAIGQQQFPAPKGGFMNDLFGSTGAMIPIGAAMVAAALGAPYLAGNIGLSTVPKTL